LYAFLAIAHPQKARFFYVLNVNSFKSIQN